MKNVTIRKGWQWMLTALLVLAVSMPAFAQDPIWTISAPTSNYFGSGNTERGVTFNPATGHIILASRQGGVTPVIIDAATGDSIGVLDNTGIAGGTFAFNQIRATADGQIFTANLATGGTGVKIYRWADESSAPAVVFEGDMDNLVRFGDALGAWGSGNDVTVLLSGTNSGIIAKFAWDGTTLSKVAEYTVTQNVGRGGFSHGIYGENSDIVWASGTGAAPVPFNIENGTSGDDLVSDDVLPADLNSSMLIDQADYRGKTWIATGPAFTNGTFYLFEVDGDGNAVLFAQTEPLGENANTNNTGGVIFDTVNGRLYLMDSNNALVAFNLDDFAETPSNIFISEYIEGSSNNKALELYNASEEEVDLSNYQIAQTSNANDGNWEFFHMFAEGATIGSGEVYVLITDQVDPALFDAANADEVLGFPSPIHFNGDDARGIIFIDPTFGDTTLLDMFGDYSATRWDVAGVSEATADYTLQRKASVMMGNPTPLGSFGTNADDSEWLVKDQNTFSNLGAPTGIPTSAAPAPMQDAADVMSVFSDAYDDVADTDFNPPWGQATAVSFGSINDDNVLIYDNLNYQGTQFASALDVSGMDYIHVDMFTDNASLVNLSLISTGPAETPVSLPVIQGEWVGYDIPLSDYSGVVNLADVIQLKFDTGAATDFPTIILDNIYFYSEAAMVEPDLAYDFEVDGTGNDLVWNTFENVDNPPVEIIDNPDASGNNTSAKVGQFIARADGQPWAGATARGSENFLFNEDNRTVSIMVWKDVISPVGIKLETASGWAEPEIQVSNTVTGEWELLTFDFTGRQLPPEGEMFNGISVFPDFNTDGRGQENIVYFDNITLSGFDVVETAQPVNVFFVINTSTALDTLQEYHSVQVRGGFLGSPQSTEAITWDAGTSVVAENIGGDYWLASVEMYPGDTLQYKVFPTFDDGAGIFNGPETGWETGDNTLVTVPEDFTDEIAVYEHWYETRENPFMEKTDSVGIKFRVNMGAQLQDLSFDPETMTVGVRGDINGWGPDIVTLEDEGEAAGDNRFYSGIVYVPDTLFQSTSGMFNYKYIFTDGTDTFWEDGDNKQAHVPESDTTIHWTFYNGNRPTDAVIVSTELSFNVDVGILEGVGYFDSSIDSVQVRGGLNGWGDSDKMTFNPLSFTWGLSGRAYTAAEGSQIAYKYYIDYDESRFDETSANYIPGINNDFGYEEPGIVGGGNRFYMIENATTQTVDEAAFYNGVEPEGQFTTPVDVTFRVDMTPATTRDDGGAAFVPSSDSVYIVFETKYFALIQGIQPGIDGITADGQEVAEQFRMTDANQDGIYEVTFSIEQFNLNHIGFVIAYGQPFNENGEFTANGGGFDEGRRYYQYVQPLVSDAGAVTWPTTFTMPTLSWQRENLPYEDVPDYQTPTSNEGDVPVAKEFALEQNYPNPFNPSTNITFTLPSTSNVRLSVYNILGQQVANIFDGKQMSSGVHTINFDATNLSSGTYIYRLEAGGAVAIKKMTLIK